MVETLYWGLKFSEWVSLVGLFLGPIVAVLLTLYIEGRRRTRDQHIQIMRMLLSTRHLAGDPLYSVAINLIPIEFNDSKPIMAAWRAYIEAVRFKPSEENAQEHNRVLLSRQTKLIFELLKHLNFDLPETDIQTSAYAADAFIQRDNILLGSQLAMADIANSLRVQTQILRGLPEQTSEQIEPGPKPVRKARKAGDAS